MDKTIFVWGSWLFGAGFLICLIWEMMKMQRRATVGPIRRSRTQFVIGAVCLAGLMVTVVWPAFASAKVSAKIGDRHQLMRAWYQAMMLYSVDNGDRLPPAENWSTLCRPYWESELEPSLRDPVNGYDPGIAFNSFFGGMSLEGEDWDPDLVMFAAGHRFDSSVTDGNYVPDPSSAVLLPEGYGHVISHQDSVRWRPD